MALPRVIPWLAAAVDAVRQALPGDIALGIPLATSKPHHFVNVQCRCIKANPSRLQRHHRQPGGPAARQSGVNWAALTAGSTLARKCSSTAF